MLLNYEKLYAVFHGSMEYDATEHFFVGSVCIEIFVIISDFIEFISLQFIDAVLFLDGITAQFHCSYSVNQARIKHSLLLNLLVLLLVN